MRKNKIEVGRIYVLGHRDGRFCDVYIRPVAVNGLSATTYNDWQAKKQKRPRLDKSALEAHVRALQHVSLVAKPTIAGNEWRTMREDAESHSHSNDGLLQVSGSCLLFTHLFVCVSA